MKEIRFYEYDGFKYDVVESNLLNELPMSESQRKHLVTLSETLVPDKQIFTIGAKTISANSIVGMISFDGIQIEILPKLLRSNADENQLIIKNLMYMLSYTNQLEIADSSLGNMAIHHESFIEAYISIFSSRLLNQLKKYGTPKSYILNQENLNTLRGKIVFPRNISINSFNQSKIFCEHSEFSENNDASKAFKFVVANLLNLTKNSSNLSTLNRCFGLLEGVSAEYVKPERLDYTAVGKRDQNFLALLNLTKMFLRKMRPDFSGHKSSKVFSLLFDMNELFEEFIFQILKKNAVSFGIEVIAQKKRKLVEKERDLASNGEWSQRSLFDTFTDIIVKPHNGLPIIIDTKYKIVSSKKSHYGIGNQDAYQVLAYKQIHSSENEIPTVALLYPKNYETIKREFQVSNSPTTFMAWTVDISKDLHKELDSLKVELHELIKHGTKAS